LHRKDPSYIKLQRHLNRQAVGFPATRSGAELRILAHIFTPRQARIATCLSYQFQSLEQIYDKARHWVDSIEALAQELSDLQAKGGLETKIEEGVSYYCNAPLVVGMYEFQLNRLTPEFLRNFDTYKSSSQFAVALLSTQRPQMRTIPIAESITVRHAVSTYDEVKSLLRQAQPPYAIFECICRKTKALKGEACHMTRRKETCLAVGHMAQTALNCGAGREISLDETLSIMDQNQKEGLVLQPSNTQKAEFICSCCGCCCGMLNMQKRLPMPLDFWTTNYYAAIDPALCTSCGKCQRRCQVNAATNGAKKEPARIDVTRCIGCGLCVPTCPGQAITLVKKPTEIKPPRTRQDLYDEIMAKKKGAWGKLKLQGSLVFDALRTGQLHLLKQQKAEPPEEEKF
jgi:Pyruvate/2-oxoacid:ferredoxin oxidoreductase delta subunit